MSVSPTPGTPRHTAQSGNVAATPTSGKPPQNVMTYSFMGDNSDEEVDAEIKDSENLNRTLTDIIEGRSPKHQNHTTNINSSKGDRDGENLLFSQLGNPNVQANSDTEPPKDSAMFSPSNMRRLEERSDDSVDFISDVETNPLFDPDDGSEACSVSLAASDISPSIKSVNSSLSQQGICEQSSHSRGTSDSGFSCSDDGFVTKDLHLSTNLTSVGMSSVHTLDSEDESGKNSVIEGSACEGGSGSSFAAVDRVKDGKCSEDVLIGKESGDLSSIPVSSLFSGSLSTQPPDQKLRQKSSRKASKSSAKVSTKLGHSSLSDAAPQRPRGFLTEWDLYEEVVVVSDNQPAQVIHNNSSAQKSVFIKQQSAPCSKLATVRGLFTRPSTGRSPLIGVDSSQPGEPEREAAGNSTAVVDFEAEDDEWTEWQSTIPDVEVIYEPSCGSLTNNGEGYDSYRQSRSDHKSDLSLKESTV